MMTRAATGLSLLCALVLLVLPLPCSGERFNVFRAVRHQEQWWARGHTARTNAHAATSANATTHVFTGAVVDHFGSWSGSHTRWRQRFYIDQTYWGGEDFPIFVYIGGEGPQGPVSSHLYMHTLAEQHQACIVALEHRFYGESRPTPDMSVKSLQVLTSEQALADLARFVEHLALTPAGAPDPMSAPPLTLKHGARGSKVVVFGGSYPGSLAAWFKLKYPALAVGSVASSAPVLAEYNFEQYAQVVSFALGYPLIGGSVACRADVDSATRALHALANSTVPYATSKLIPEALKPCAPPSTLSDFAMYLSTIFGNFQGTVQYNLEASPLTVAVVCDTMLQNKTTLSPVQRLGQVMALFVNTTAPFAERCVQSSFQEDLVDLVANTSFTAPGCNLTCNSTRQWIWQSCNEFGFFQTTTGDDQAFHFPELTVDQAGQALCQAAFPGAWGAAGYTRPRTDWTNTHYGNRNIASVNTTLPNGNADPWHSLGVSNESDAFYESCLGEDVCSKQQLHANDHLVFLDGTGHCRDMYAPNFSKHVPDTASVQWAHAEIADHVATYLS